MFNVKRRRGSRSTRDEYFLRLQRGHQTFILPQTPGLLCAIAWKTTNKPQTRRKTNISVSERSRTNNRTQNFSIEWKTIPSSPLSFTDERNEKGCSRGGEDRIMRNGITREKFLRACSDSDVSANDGTDAVHGGTLINSPVDVLSEDLGLEARKVDGPVAKDVPDSRDTRYTATVRRQPVDGRCRISSHCAVHPAPVHVREFHPRRWLRHEAWPLHLVRGVATCNETNNKRYIFSHTSLSSNDFSLFLFSNLTSSLQWNKNISVILCAW